MGAWLVPTPRVYALRSGRLPIALGRGVATVWTTDAAHLAKLLRLGEVTPVRVPDRDAEAPTAAEPLIVLIVDEIASLTGLYRRPKDPHRSRTARGTAAAPGPRGRCLRRRSDARSVQRRPADQTAIFCPGRVANDRIQPNHDGPGRRGTGGRRSATRSLPAQQVSGTSASTERTNRSGFVHSTSPTPTSTTWPPTSHPTSGRPAHPTTGTPTNDAHP